MFNPTRILILFIFLIGISCNSTSKTTDQQKAENSIKLYQEVAQEIYEGEINYELNDSSTHVICSNLKTENNFKYTSFFVYDILAKEIIYKPNKRFRKVYWSSDKEIKAEVMTGMPVGDGALDYIVYNIESRKQSTNRENKE